MDFYNNCINILFKGINIILNRVESEILSYNFENIHFLYKYTHFNIDLEQHLIKQLFNTKNFDLDCNTNSTDLSMEESVIMNIKNQVEIIYSKILNVKPSNIISIEKASIDTEEQYLFRMKWNIIILLRFHYLIL